MSTIKTSNKSNRISTKNLPELTVALKCADCVHFGIQPHVEFKKPCKDLGIKDYARGCDKYNPNVARLARNLGALESVMEVVGNLSESDIRLFMISAYKSAQIEKATNGKFKFGSKVYFNLSAPHVEYLDSYYSGVVIGFIAGDESSPNGYLHIAGSLSDEAGTSITLPFDSVLSQTRWNITFRKLTYSNKFQTPSSKKLRFECAEVTTPEEYEVPTLDMSLDEIKSLNRGKKKAQNSKLDSLKETAFDEDEDDNIQDVETYKPKKTKGLTGKDSKTDVITFN